jgi:hypothetical protein
MGELSKAGFGPSPGSAAGLGVEEDEDHQDLFGREDAELRVPAVPGAAVEGPGRIVEEAGTTEPRRLQQRL